MKTCTKCKKNKAVMKYKGGVYCVECAPELRKTDDKLGVGIRYKKNNAIGREIKGKKPDLCRKSTHTMRSKMGMTYSF